jgi:hypothetical protein
VYRYKSGVIDDVRCGKQMDHAVLVTGYGVDAKSGKAYWRVKNSWGSDWGEAGYVRMVQGKDMCGIADQALYPVGVTDWTPSAAARPASKDCPKPTAPAPPLPRAYVASRVKSCYSRACDSPTYGTVAVSNAAGRLSNNVYNTMPGDVKLQRCDHGHNYYVNHTTARPTCTRDPTSADEQMTCPWDRHQDEIMSGLNEAAISKRGVACLPGATADALRCDLYVSGDDSYRVSFYVRNSTDGETVIPVREVQEGGGAGGFYIWYVFNGLTIGEPPASAFDVPVVCRSEAASAGNHTGYEAAAAKEGARAALAAMRKARAQRQRA